MSPQAARTTARKTARGSRLPGAGLGLFLILAALLIDDRLAARLGRDGAEAATRLYALAERQVRGETPLASTRLAPVPAGAPAAAGFEASAVLTGTWRAADDATRAGPGDVTFTAAQIAFTRGGSLRSAPLRIARGADAWARGRTLQSDLGARPDEQVELRRVVAPAGSAQVAASPLCGGQPPAALALLQRRDEVRLLLISRGGTLGAAGDPARLCGVWRWRR